MDSVRYDGGTLAKQLLRMDMSFTSVAKRTDMKMGLAFLFTRTPRTQSWGASQFPAGSSPFVSGQHLLTLRCAGLCSNNRL